MHCSVAFLSRSFHDFFHTPAHTALLCYLTFTILCFLYMFLLLNTQTEHFPNTKPREWGTLLVKDLLFYPHIYVFFRLTFGGKGILSC